MKIDQLSQIHIAGRVAAYDKKIVTCKKILAVLYAAGRPERRVFDM
jgi:hypothetical protein